MAVDVGYTVLVVPRGSITSISKTDESSPPAKTAAAGKPVATAEAKPAVESKSNFYYAAVKPAPSAMCANLVNQLGEAVVQVAHIALGRGLDGGVVEIGLQLDRGFGLGGCNRLPGGGAAGWIRPFWRCW